MAGRQVCRWLVGRCGGEPVSTTRHDTINKGIRARRWLIGFDATDRRKDKAKNGSAAAEVRERAHDQRPAAAGSIPVRSKRICNDRNDTEGTPIHEQANVHHIDRKCKSYRVAAARAFRLTHTDKHERPAVGFN